MTVIAAIAFWRAAVIVVIAIARGWATAAIAFHGAAPTRWAITVATRTIAGRAVVATHFMIVVTIAIAWRAIRTSEAAAGAIAIAEPWWAIGADIAFDEAAFQPAFEVAFKVTARRTIGTGATIGGEAGAFRWRRHVLVDVFRKGHELFFAQFAVAIFVELREHLLRLRHFRRASVMAIGTVVAVWAVTFGTMAVIRHAHPRVADAQHVRHRHLSHDGVRS